MKRTSVSRLSLAAFGAVALTGLATAAHADILFHNITSQPLHFAVTCSGLGAHPETVAPYGTQAIVCTNGSPVAAVEIRTSHGPFDEVVRAMVRDGSSYNLGYDHAGDVSIAPRS